MPVALRIAGRAAVAQRHVEHAVQAKRQHAAVVIRKRLRLREQHLRRRGVRAARVTGDAVLSDHRGAPPIGVEHEESAVRDVVGMEGQTQQPALVGTRVDDGTDVQERVRGEPAVGDDANAAFLLDHKQAPRSVSRVSGEDGPDEAAHDNVGGEAPERLRRGCRCWLGDRCGCWRRLRGRGRSRLGGRRRRRD